MVPHSMKVSSMPLSIIAIIQASDFFLCSIVIVMSSYFLPVLHKSVLFYVTVRPCLGGFFSAPLFRTLCISLQV